MIKILISVIMRETVGIAMNCFKVLSRNFSSFAGSLRTSPSYLKQNGVDPVFPKHRHKLPKTLRFDLTFVYTDFDQKNLIDLTEAFTSLR
jgi:hypothetical protein